MKTIKLEKVEYNIPENWGDVTIRQQMLVDSLTD